MFLAASASAADDDVAAAAVEAEQLVYDEDDLTGVANRPSKATCA